ncbi:MAG: hypothetical protein ACW98Y_15795, partial [Candidatus Thorarchaeota archaeon]
IEENNKRLDFIKRSYYKLHRLANNNNINLTDEVRTTFRNIAEQILGFMVDVRRKDFFDRMKIFDLEIGDVLDTGHLIKTSVEKTSFVLLPPSYNEFPLASLKVLDEFLEHPERLPVVGTRQLGIIIKQMFWVFGAAATLALTPRAGVDPDYTDFYIREYLRTTALAVFKARNILERALVRLSETMSAENVLVDCFKNLSKSHYFQGTITREMIIEALEHGHWDARLADRIIEDKQYCVFCSYDLPDGATQCPNCEREVKELDLDAIAIEEVEIDMGELNLDMDEGGGL